MLYAIYLIGLTGITVWGIGLEHMWAFVDSVTLYFILLFCVFCLVFTKSLKPFGRSFLLAFGKKNDSLVQCRESLQSVKMVMLMAALSGLLGFLIGSINGLKFSDALSPDIVYHIALDTSVAFISIFYAVCICVILLPVYFMVKKHIIILENAGETTD